MRGGKTMGGARSSEHLPQGESPAQPLATVTLQPGPGKLYPTGMQWTDWVLAPTLTQPPVLQKETRHKAEQPLPDRLSSATTAHTYPLESYPLFLVIPSPYLVCSLSGQHSPTHTVTYQLLYHPQLLLSRAGYLLVECHFGKKKK